MKILVSFIFVFLLCSCEKSVTESVTNNVFVFETVLNDPITEEVKKLCSAKITLTFSEEDKCVYYIFSETWHDESNGKDYRIKVALKDQIGNHLHVIEVPFENGTIPIRDLSYSKLERTKEIELKLRIH